MTEPATHEVRPRGRQNLRAVWENQHDNSIKRTVDDELSNWGRYYRDNGPNIGYPTQVPYYVPPRDPRDKPQRREPPDAIKAEWTEDQFVMWRLMIKQSPPHIREHMERLHDIAVLRYVDRLTMGEVGEAVGISRRHTYRLQDELLFRYWAISK